MLRSLSRLWFVVALCGTGVVAFAQSPPAARYPGSHPPRQQSGPPEAQRREQGPPPAQYQQQRPASQQQRPYPQPTYPAQQGGYQQGPQPLPPVVPAQHMEGQPGQGGQPPLRNIGPQQPQPVRSPFQLTAQQQAEVDQVLTTWEMESSKIKTYSSIGFERWEYDPVFGPSGDIAKTRSEGQLKYVKPDKGMFKIQNVFVYDPKSGKHVPEKEAFGEHWVCDGKAIYEFNAQLKQVTVRSLPPELQGKAIADGPIPFLFGAEKKKIEQRYFVCITDRKPAETVSKPGGGTERKSGEIWIKAYPKYQFDAANFDYVEIILSSDRFLPSALMVYLPGSRNVPDEQRARTLYLFPDAKVNDRLDRFLGVFEQPRTPLGWKRIEERSQANSAPAGNQPPDQARRPLQFPR